MVARSRQGRRRCSRLVATKPRPVNNEEHNATQNDELADAGSDVRPTVSLPLIHAIRPTTMPHPRNKL